MIIDKKATKKGKNKKGGKAAEKKGTTKTGKAVAKEIPKEVEATDNNPSVNSEGIDGIDGAAKSDTNVAMTVYICSQRVTTFIGG